MLEIFWTGERFDPQVATISDYWGLFLALLKFVYFFPGNFVIYVTMDEYPRVAHFLEFSLESFNGWFSGILSLILWIIFFLTLVVISATFEAWSKVRQIKKEKKEREKALKRRRELGYDD